MAIDETLKYIAVISLLAAPTEQGAAETYVAFISRVSGYAGSNSFDIYLKVGTYTPVAPHVLATS